VATYYAFMLRETFSW